MGNTKGAARRVTKTAATSGTGQLRDDEMQHGGLSGKQMGQLLRAYMLMSQVRYAARPACRACQCTLCRVLQRI